MKRLSFALLVFFAAFGLLGQLETARAAITWTGNLDPADPTTWTSSRYGYVGKTADGSLTVDEGDELQSLRGFIGFNSDVRGQMTVSGARSTWTITHHLHVGELGNGTLTICDGGSVTSVTNETGVYPLSTGEVTVSGHDSIWNNSCGIIVGHAGKATLTITDGGTVLSGWGDIAFGAGSTGATTVSGAGSTWANSQNLVIGYSGSGTLAITNGGLVSVGRTLAIDDKGGDDSFINMTNGGALALAGDADDSLADFLNLIDGSNAIRYWDDVLGNWADIMGATPGTDYTLAHIDDSGSELYGYTLLTVWAIPEPGTILMLLVGAAMLLVRRGR